VKYFILDSQFCVTLIFSFGNNLNLFQDNLLYLR
jgi:hypothetical protein